MAGLGEACSHIGAVLFYLETYTKMYGEKTCTELKCQWVIPAYQKDIPYLPVKHLDFSSAERKQKQINATVTCPQLSACASPVESNCSVTVDASGSSELDNFSAI